MLRLRRPAPVPSSQKATERPPGGLHLRGRTWLANRTIATVGGFLAIAVAAGVRYDSPLLALLIAVPALAAGAGAHPLVRGGMEASKVWFSPEGIRLMNRRGEAMPVRRPLATWIASLGRLGESLYAPGRRVPGAPVRLDARSVWYLDAGQTRALLDASTA